MSSDGLNQFLLNKYRRLIYSRYGIFYAPSKTYLLRVKQEKIRERFGDLAKFYETLATGDERAEAGLLREITIGHTYFFREKEHLEFLVQDIRRQRLFSPSSGAPRARRGRNRILSRFIFSKAE